ncbi:MAG: hypothetical protein DME60_06145 [Verrucomicrobia bacterium]|nr:MAG: hypothetical protein DME60_06145 [Verrucomicrobiota bacterium]
MAVILAICRGVGWGISDQARPRKLIGVDINEYQTDHGSQITDQVDSHLRDWTTPRPEATIRFL